MESSSSGAPLLAGSFGMKAVGGETKVGMLSQMAKKAARYLYQQAQLIEDDDLRDKALTHARRSESRKAREATVALAQSEPGTAVSPDKFDQNPYLLNVLNGTIDLRTGELREHRREDLISRIVHISYDPEAKGASWG